MAEYIDLGRVVGDTGVSTRYRGDWLTGTEYVNDSQYIDLVTHVGCLWICETTNTSEEPSTSAPSWRLAARGMDDGADISDAISTLSVPSSYTEPTSGLSIKEHLSRMVRGMRNLFSNVGSLSSLQTTAKGNLVSAINENKTSISELNSNLEDTGWIDILGTSIAGSGVKAPTSGVPIKYRRKSGVVYIQGTIGVKGRVSGANHIICTMPIGYRPSQKFYSVNTATGALISRYLMSDSGALSIEWIRKVADGTEVTGDCAWIGIDLAYPI